MVAAAPGPAPLHQLLLLDPPPSPAAVGPAPYQLMLLHNFLVNFLGKFFLTDPRCFKDKVKCRSTIV